CDLFCCSSLSCLPLARQKRLHLKPPIAHQGGYFDDSEQTLQELQGLIARLDGLHADIQDSEQ
ncbi:MAG: hypothetical protein AAFQ68_22220, partial [Bacteroidota bacterium]